MKSRHQSLILYLLLTLFSINIYATGSTNTDGASWWNTDYNTTEGTDFWVTFMFNYGNTPKDTGDLKLKLIATSRKETKVRILYTDGTSETFHVAANGRTIHTIDLSKGYVMQEQKIENKGIHITSDVPISIYAVSQNETAGSQDGTAVYPTIALSKEYVIPTYGTDGISTEFAIVAIKDNTIITDFVIKKTHISPTLSSDTTIVSLTLNAGDAYLYRSNDARISLSGTKICASEPIAIFSGGQHADIPMGTPNRNHIYSQIAPTDYWGKTYVCTNTSHQQLDYLRFIALKNNTTLSNPNRSITLQSLETYQDTLKTSYGNTNAIVYKTTEALEAFLYLTDMNCNMVPNDNPSSLGSPAMCPITPMEQAMHSVIFSTLDAPNIQKHYVNIVTNQSQKNNIFLDNHALNGFIDIPNSTFCFIQCPIDTGAHIIYCNNDGIEGVFTAHVYGLGRFGEYGRGESYAYSAGSRVNRSADLLIDGQYIKEKDICITDGVTFTPIINYDYTHYKFNFYKRGNNPLTSGEQTITQDFTRQFPDTGKWEINLIVERTTPICDYLLYDTIRANIIVHDTIHLDYGYDDGKNTNICYGEEFTVHYDSTKYHYKADTTTLQTIWGKQQKFELNKTYTFIDTLHTKLGCDSIITQRVCIRPTYEYTVYDTICHKDIPYTYIDPITRKENDGKLANLTKSGDYTDHRQTVVYGCDSIIHLHLIVNPDYLIDTTKQICSNQDFYWQGRHYVGEDFTPILRSDIIVPMGTKYDSIHYWTSDPYRCDSIHTLHLTVKDTFVVSMTYTTCVHVPLSPAPNFNLSKFPEYSIDKVGTQVYVDSLTTKAGGCDSIVIFTLHVLPRYDILQIDTVCQHPINQYIWEQHTGHEILDSIANKHIRTIPTDKRGWHTYIDHQYTKHGHCDSIHTLRLYVAPVYSFMEQREICDNDSIHWRGKVFVGNKAPDDNKARIDTDHILQAGTYQDIDTAHYNTSIGCDSIYHLDLLVKPTVQTTLTYHHCTSEGTVTYEKTLFDISYVRTIDTTFHYSTATQCDSAVALHIVVDSAYYFVEDSTVCQHSPFAWSKHDTVKISTNTAGDFTYYHRLKTKHDCDSIYQLNLHINPTYRITDKPLRICNNDSIRWKGRLYVGDKALQSIKDLTTPERILPYKDGGYIDSIRYDSQFGCDSMRVVQIFVDTTAITHLNYHYCTSEKQTTLENTLFDLSYVRIIDTTFHYSTATQCDSAVVLHIVVDSAYYFVEDSTVCQHSPFAWSKHDTVKISTNTAGDFTYYHRLKTKHGCDSIYQLNLHINPTYYFDSTLTICEGDSVEWQHLYRYGKDTARIESTDYFGDRMFVTTDYDTTYHTIAGCDSIYHLHLIVNPRKHSHFNVHVCENEQYRFGDSIVIQRHPGYYHDTLRLSTATGCDSILTLELTVHPTYHEQYHDTICQNDNYIWKDHQDHKIYSVERKQYLTSIPTDTYGDWVFIDSLQTQTCQDCPNQGCDSIWTLYLHINPTYYSEDTITMSDEEIRKWEHTIYAGYKVDIDTINNAWFQPEITQGMAKPQIIRIPQNSIINHFDTTYPTIDQCDSVRSLRLLVGPTYRDTIIRWTCDNEPYHWYHDGDDKEARTDLTLLKPQLYFDSLKTQAFGFDSIYVLDLRNYPTYHFSHQDTICQGTNYTWEGHNESTHFYSVNLQQWIEVDKIPTSISGTYTYIDSLKTKEPLAHTDQTFNHGCDSVWTLTLVVPPSYYFDSTLTICDNDSVRWQRILYTGDKFKDFHKTYNSADYDSVKTLPAGIYYDTLRYETKTFLCDSIYRLKLIVLPTYHSEFERHTCQESDTYYEQMHNGLGGTVPTDIAGTIIYYDTIPAISNGCDSVIKMTYYIHPTYHYLQHDTICQDTISTIYEWQDEFGGTHDNVAISIGKAGDFYYGDTLPTIFGCDSTFGIHLHVSPIYRFDSTYTICDNEFVTWQGKRYVGNRYGNITSTDVVVSAGIHHDVAHYLTIENCDSTYYLQLIVHSTYDTISYITSCKNEDFVWLQYDHNGIYTDSLWRGIMVDTFRISSEEAILPQPYKYPDTIRYERMLNTIYDCDSLSHIELTLHSAYLFYTDTAICSNEK